MNLPEPIAAYFAAKNRKDIDAMLLPFAADAIVKDEGEELRGHAPIRAWMEKTTKKYAVTVEPRKIETKDGGTVVTALVSGNFPGSPAELHYAFRLGAGKITGLEIG
jgi:ketosteroid isomerase-like protein